MNSIIDVGPYRFSIEGCPKYILSQLKKLYDDSVGFAPEKPIDYCLSIKSTSFIRKFLKPQICIYIDNHRPFNPIAPKMLLPSLEWGMNWCIASHDYSHLLIHSAVLVKNGKAVIFPAVPGSGKSTLAAYFSLRGWSVYSDEMAIIPLNSNLVVPMHRPASLKNRSIDIIRKNANGQFMSTTTYGTHKGDIAHLKLSNRSSFEKLSEAKIVAAIFPKYREGGSLAIEQITQLEGFAKFVHHSFNYSILGEQGFETLKNVVFGAQFYTAKYSSYNGIDQFLEELVI
ncbi:HprK-related kinase A [Flavobacterium sp. W21_SRS_FM6]|uniref:HprK-related kinase A n=1 Tax=Flavobacterium sp. W21_SRS_FM6 TaxID=3240268 RepID=UPI003F915876